MLLSFPRANKMKGMGQIVSWSVRDESLHVKYMIQLFREFIKENKEIWTDEFKAELYQICRDMVELEDNFIDLSFEMGNIEGLTKEDTKLFVRHIADRRLLQLGLKANYKVKDNPLPWFDDMIGGVEHANFFEARPTAYSKGGVSGSFL
jgi:ribonucleoside-diphosphate reductase beta chain